MINGKPFHYTDVFSNSERNCDQTENAYRYYLKLLPEDKRQQFELHLSKCEACTEVLSELAECDLALENTVPDLEKEDRIFEQNRRKIEEALKQKYGGGKSANFQLRPVRRITFLNAALLLLIATLSYPAYRSTVLNTRVAELEDELKEAEKHSVSREPTLAPAAQPNEAPSIAQSHLYRVSSQRGLAEDQKIDVTFDRNQQRFTLLFSVPSEDFQSYTVQITADDRNIWQATLPSTRSPQPQLISVQLESTYFQAGEYALQITGQSPERQIRFPKFQLMISKKQ